ncbi:MAG TPA: glycosyltransferase family 9 protein [Thermoanaerobaculia bacterium]|nr:glycosyltransferase family 9 protein [Thermoanaerobaculia bacterium]
MTAAIPVADGAHVLLVRTSSLGDVVHALPVLTALRRHLPRARLGWVVEEPYAPLLAGHPDLDELIVVRLRQWGRRPLAAGTLSGIAAFLADLDRFAPQVVIDLMGNHKAAVIAALSLAPRRVGHARAGRREPSSALWLSERVPVAGTHAVDRALSLLDGLGLPREPADFGGEKLFRAPGQAAAAKSGILPAASPFALLHPGAGWGNKAYPPAWWGETVRRLHAATGVRTRVAAAPGEEGLAAAVVAAAAVAGDPAAPTAAELVSAPDLPALAALLRGAALMMGGDTGPTHLAHALGTPVLMVMGPTDPERHGPYGAPERAVVRRLPCSFCHRRFGEAKACLLEISPVSLAGRAAGMLAESSGHGPASP